MPQPPPSETLTLPHPPPVCDIAPGTVVGGKYRIVAHIGSGGMGAVYLAVDTGPLARPFALKLLANPTPAAHARFLHEAQIMGTLHHPNIVSVTDFGTDPATGFDFYVMDEYLPTPDETERLCRDVLHCPPPAPRPLPAPLSLARLIDGHKTLPEAAVRSVALQLLSAIEAAHALSPPVIHRDIKPSNILFSPDGRALLADFGIAKRLAPGETSPTLPGATPGTPAYAAPEQLAGAPVGPAADYYSFGVVLYRALTGGMPFPSPALPADIAPAVSPVWADLFPTLLEKDPAKRLVSPARIRALLEHTARPPRSRLRPVHFALPALALALLFALFPLFPRPHPASPSPTSPDGQPSVGQPTPQPETPPSPAVQAWLRHYQESTAKNWTTRYLSALQSLLNHVIAPAPDADNLIRVGPDQILLSCDVTPLSPPPTILLDGGTLLFSPGREDLFALCRDCAYYLEHAPDTAPLPDFLPATCPHDFYAAQFSIPIHIGANGGHLKALDALQGTFGFTLPDGLVPSNSPWKKNLGYIRCIRSPILPADGLDSATLHTPPGAPGFSFTALDDRVDWRRTSP